MPYTFYLDGVQLPVTPGRLQAQIGNQNKTYSLISGDEINVLKTPGLMELSFDMRLPQTSYPFARDDDAASYIDRLETLKERRKPFRLIITRTLPGGRMLFDTNIRVSLEDYTLKEDAGEGFDVIAGLKLKEYRPYGTKTIPVPDDLLTPPDSGAPRPGDSPPSAGTHTVVAGDCLWNIAQRYLGDGSRYPEVYRLNQSVIDKGNEGTGNPKYTIYPGQVLKLPAA
ncbi:LysM peptidoglycan-binding domain-containing protein [Anaerotruncus colihominis]|uniref:LysM peptidoglycan-binding domain-containing protein n=1 Tax=Anaerotruncus colihominis TaxID=169435 RepID=UPI0026EA1BF5|nr:LysM peptidoglycan-binding domain-containing protein [Anaerotruncus colihominis]